jgi:hypothetical protein
MLRSLARLVVLVPVLATGACHRYVTPVTPLVPGQEVALVVTDRGRAELSDRVGPELDQLRGRLVARTDTSISLSMRQALSLRSGSTTWTGETLTVNSALLATVREKRLDKGRTVLLAGGVTAAFVAFILTRDFLGGNSEVETDPSQPPTGPGPATVRVPLTLLFRSH